MEAVETGTQNCHRPPRRLLELRDRAEAHTEPLSGEGIQLWVDFEMEALRRGVDPDTGREELAAMVEPEEPEEKAA